MAIYMRRWNPIIIHYPLENDTIDTSGNDNHWTKWTWVSFNNKVAVFDGTTNAYINTPVYELEDTYTFNVWFNLWDEIGTGNLITRTVTWDNKKTIWMRIVEDDWDYLIETYDTSWTPIEVIEKGWHMLTYINTKIDWENLVRLFIDWNMYQDDYMEKESTWVEWSVIKIGEWFKWEISDFRMEAIERKEDKTQTEYTEGKKTHRDWWQPNENTLLYVPFKSWRTSDESLSPKTPLLNNHITTTTIWWVECMPSNRDSWVSYYLWNNTKYTISMRVKFNDDNSWNIAYDINNNWTSATTTIWYWISVWRWSNNSLTWNKNFWYYCHDWKAQQTWKDNPIWVLWDTVWHNITFTIDWNKTIYYLDWVNKYNYTNAYSSTYNQILIWRRNLQNEWFSWYMSEFIVENKTRTSQEVSDYYNQTKSLYGIQ